MVKSPDAYRTISEVADWLGAPAHVLRFWESKFRQVKPLKRAGGRRYYRPPDMQLLSGIKKLLHDDGMTIKGVQKILKEQGVKHVIDMSNRPLEAEGIDEALSRNALAPVARKNSPRIAGGDEPNLFSIYQGDTHRRSELDVMQDRNAPQKGGVFLTCGPLTALSGDLHLCAAHIEALRAQIPALQRLAQRR